MASEPDEDDDDLDEDEAADLMEELLGARAKPVKRLTIETRDPKDTSPTSFLYSELIAIEMTLGVDGLTGNEKLRKDLRKEVRTVADALAGEAPSPAVAALARAAAVAWVGAQVAHARTWVNTSHPSAFAMFARLSAQAQARFVRTVEAVARVRRLEAPIILAQLNVGGVVNAQQSAGPAAQQVNGARRPGKKAAVVRGTDA